MKKMIKLTLILLTLTVVFTFACEDNPINGKRPVRFSSFSYQQAIYDPIIPK